MRNENGWDVWNAILCRKNRSIFTRVWFRSFYSIYSKYIKHIVIRIESKWEPNYHFINKKS